MFSNFLTTTGKVNDFKPNLEDILHDAAPGSVLLILGGKQRQYRQYLDVYKNMDQLASEAGFQLKIGDKTVSSSDSETADRVYEEGQRFYKHLQELSPNKDDDTQKVRNHFEGSRRCASSSELRAYRKY